MLWIGNIASTASVACVSRLVDGLFVWSIYLPAAPASFYMLMCAGFALFTHVSANLSEPSIPNDACWNKYKMEEYERTILARISAYLIISSACAPDDGGYSATNRVAFVSTSTACLDRLNGRRDALDIRCVSRSDVPGASLVHVDDCVHVTRADESGRVKRLTIVSASACGASLRPPTVDTTRSPSTDGPVVN